MMDINKILSKLSESRPIFYSEADFQHALAWEIHKSLDNCSMRLEFKPMHINERMYVDVWLIRGNKIVAIELKYKTRYLDVNIKNENFKLLDQSAQDVGRYDVIKDVQRLEQIVLCKKNIEGYVIFLTNDRAYWKEPSSSKTVDANFRLHQDRILTGKLKWGVRASKGTMSGREKILKIKGSYKLCWEEYSSVNDKAYGKFRYLLVKI